MIKWKLIICLLKKNIEIAEAFLVGMGLASKSDAIDSAYIWRNVSSDYIISEFLEKYKVFSCSPLHIDIPIFINWMKQMNNENRYLKWNVAVAGDKKASERWNIAGADVGKIERSRKKKPKYVDIGSLRSGRDILSDICVEDLSPDKKKLFNERKKNGKNLIRLRYEVGLEDIPLLLLYRIDKDKGKDSKYRMKINTTYDIIGFSIVVSGQEANPDYVRTVQVKKPD